MDITTSAFQALFTLVILSYSTVGVADKNGLTPDDGRINNGSGPEHFDSDEPIDAEDSESEEDYEACDERELNPIGQPDVCVGAEIYGALHRRWVDDRNEGRDQSDTDYQFSPLIRAALPDIQGVNITGFAQIDFDEIGSETSEAYLTLNHGIWSLTAGKIEVGGIDQGNEFMSELGEDTLGEYGNPSAEQSYLVLSAEPWNNTVFTLGYGVWDGDISFEEENNNGDISNINLVIEYQWQDTWILAAEYEYIHYDDNKQNLNEDGEPNHALDSEYAFGLGVSYHCHDLFMPFLNLGRASLNDEETRNKHIKTYELNIGINSLYQDTWGVTLGYEKLGDDGRLEDDRKTVDIHNGYFGIRYQLSLAYIGVTYWRSDQRVKDDHDNLSEQFDIELGMVF